MTYNGKQNRAVSVMPKQIGKSLQKAQNGRNRIRRLPKLSNASEITTGARNSCEWALIKGDAAQSLKTLPDESVDCTVTSPPYYWQRDYRVKRQIGHEKTIEAYIGALVTTFREVKRVLKRRGLLFLVMGDTYYSGKGQPQGWDPKHRSRAVSRKKYRAVDRPGFGLPKKTLIGIPWRLALALINDGWILRSAVTWKKPKPTPMIAHGEAPNTSSYSRERADTTSNAAVYQERKTFGRSRHRLKTAGNMPRPFRKHSSSGVSIVDVRPEASCLIRSQAREQR
jgi:hypothetical protein